MAKDCQKLKKEKEIRKYYKYNKVGHFAKNYRLGQKIKKIGVYRRSQMMKTITKRGVLSEVWSRHDIMNFYT